MRRILAILTLAILLLAVPATALAASPQNDGGGKLVLGGVFTLGPGQTLNEDLVVIGGVATLAHESTVNGDVAIIGGALTADGTVNGDVSVIGGAVTFGEQSIVTGNVQSFAAAVTRAEGSQVYGEEITGQIREPGFHIIPLAPSVMAPQVRVIPTEGIWSVGAMGAMQGVWYIIRALLMGGLAVLAVIFWPKSTERTSQAIARAPWSAGGLGVLTAIVVPVLIVVLAITICLIPLAILAGMVFVAALVFGWIAVGLEVGVRLARAFKWQLEPAPAAGLGTLLVTFVAYGIAFIPCIGWLVPLIVGALGLGGVLLTRFGSREYVPAGAAQGGSLPPATN